jgi:site-specific DNA-cytosine methylase
LTDDEIRDTAPCGIDKKAYSRTPKGFDYSHYFKAVEGRNNAFNHRRMDDAAPSFTLTGNSDNIKHWDKCRKLTFREYKRLGSFPDDYQAKTDKIGKYMIGMSVPPKMTEAVARAVVEQWLK